MTSLELPNAAKKQQKKKTTQNANPQVGIQDERDGMTVSSLSITLTLEIRWCKLTYEEEGS